MQCETIFWLSDGTYLYLAPDDTHMWTWYPGSRLRPDTSWSELGREAIIRNMDNSRYTDRRRVQPHELPEEYLKLVGHLIYDPRAAVPEGL